MYLIIYVFDDDEAIIFFYSFFFANISKGWYYWYFGENVCQCRLYATFETEDIVGVLQTFNNK